MSSNPLSSSCGNLYQLNRQSQLNGALLNNMINKQMYSGNVPINRGQSVENWSGSPALMQNSYVSSPQNIQNLQQLQHLIGMQQQQNKQALLANPYLQRRNLSLTDISSSNQLKLLTNGAPFLPYPFDAASLSQSMDELLVDEDDSYSEEDNCSSNSSRKHRHKKNSRQVKRSSSRGSAMNENQSLLNQKLIRRSQSSAHLISPMQLNPYDFDYVQQSQLLANLYYGQPLLNAATISPDSSIRSLEAVRRKNSVSSMLSNRTLVTGEYNDLEDSYKSKHTKYRRQRDRSATRQPTKSLCRSKSQSSNRSSKSYKSSSYADKSNRCMSSDSEVNDEECSASSCKSNLDDSTTTHSEADDKQCAPSYRKKSWTCKGCTFTNHIQMNICEICAKTNPQLLKKSENAEQARSGRRQPDKQSKEIKTKNAKTKHETATGLTKSDHHSDHHSKRPTGYIEFTEELIKQQKEVEKELLRRIANEKLVEEENQRLEREQQQLNDKSRTAINSQRESAENKSGEFQAETDDLIKVNEIKTKTNSSSPVSSSVSSSLNNSNNNNGQNNGNLVNGLGNRGAGNVSKIRPPSFSLRQQINQFNNGSLTNKTAPLTKTQSLDSSTPAVSNFPGRHREEQVTSATKQFAEKKQFGVGKGSAVQQLASQQYNQRNTAPKSSRALEANAAPQSVSLIDQPIRESDYDKKFLDGMQMFKLLKEAERKDFLAEELEIALSFNSNDPIGWLDENWSSMKETVLTLANNQLLGLCQERNSCLITVNEDDARRALRFTKGNIWQAVDRCVNLKKPEIRETQMNSRIPVYAADKQDVKSFIFNLKSLGQGTSNRDGNQAINSPRSTDSILSNNQINQMESLLNDWYQKNLKSQSKTPPDASASQPNTSEKVKNLIAFLKQNGFFDTNKLSQDEIDEQMRILMKLLEQKLKETQESNQTKQNDCLIDTTSANSSPVKEAGAVDNLVGLEQEFEEIDEKMQQSLNFLEEIERKTSPKKQETKRLNYKNLRITSKVSVDDEAEFQDASDEPVHNINIKLENTPVEVSAKCNIKKEKGKIKIIKRKIYRGGPSEQQKSFEKIAYVNSMEEADLINLDEEINLNEVKQPIEVRPAKEETKKTSFNYVNDQEYDERQISLEKSNNQLLIDDEVVQQLNLANPNFKYARTVYECGICCSKHHINELISMLFCEHRACKACLEKYFTIQIREKQRVLIKCAFCDQPEIQSDDENAVHDYLTLLQELVKNIVSKDLYELFQRKVRDRALHKDPNFKWCPNCSSGFLAANVEGNILRCPDCKSLSCSKCNELWKEEHRVLTCEQFKEWLLGGNDWMAEHKLSVHLNEFGITCPNPKCRFRYELSKGGCLHFKCAQCEHEFCYGCDASFRTGDVSTKYYLVNSFNDILKIMRSQMISFLEVLYRRKILREIRISCSPPEKLSILSERQKCGRFGEAAFGKYMLLSQGLTSLKLISVFSYYES